MFRRSRKLNRVGKKFVSQRKLFGERLENRMLLAGELQNEPLTEYPKLSGELTDVYQQYASFTSDTSAFVGPVLSNEVFHPSNDWLLALDGRVAVELTGLPGAAEFLQSGLASIGATGVRGKELDTFAAAAGWIEYDSIPLLRDLKGAVMANAGYRSLTNTGSVTTKGDIAQKTDELRDFLGYEGLNQKVGVISDSFNVDTSANDREYMNIDSYDLPGSSTHPYGNTTPVQVLEEGTGKDEGRAMLQLIHDIAPKAQLSFATGLGFEWEMAENIDLLIDNGATIIVDDLLKTREPMFLDGPIAVAVDDAVSRNVTYVSAAGNFAKSSYHATGFTSSGLTYTAGRGAVSLHDFNPGGGVDAYQAISNPGGGSITIEFQWEDLFKSWAPSSSGAVNDFDIFLFDSNNNYLAKSESSNVGGDPREFISYANPGNLTSFNIAIGKYSGSSNADFKYVIFNPYVSIIDFPTNSGTAYGHTNAAGAISVGAAPYFSTPEFGVSPPQLEDFSSTGGVPILFNSQGQSISPLDRLKPDIVAPDGGETTFFYSVGFSPLRFYGTSAAAPHIAGLVALLRSYNSSLTQSQIRTALTSTATDMGVAGRDSASGYGLVNATQAFLSLDGSTPRPVTYKGTTTHDDILVET